jgi:hypothetical protein
MVAMKNGKEVLDRLLTSEAKGEILTLYHRNPGLVDTLDGVCRRIGRNREQIETDVNEFVEMGILKNVKVGKLSLFALDAQKDQEIQLSIAEYFRSLKK